MLEEQRAREKEAAEQAERERRRQAEKEAEVLRRKEAEATALAKAAAEEAADNWEDEVPDEWDASDDQAIEDNTSQEPKHVGESDISQNEEAGTQGSTEKGSSMDDSSDDDSSSGWSTDSDVERERRLEEARAYVSIYVTSIHSCDNLKQ